MLTAKSLVVDKNPGSQKPYFLRAHRKSHGDGDIVAIQDWLEEHYAENVTLEALAARAGMSVRSLGRRFRGATGEAPAAYQRSLRIEAARRMLERTTKRIEEIVYAVGYDDPRSFARLFRRETGASPGEYRRRFGVAATTGSE